MNIRMLENNEQPPMELLLLADPSEKLIQAYLYRGQCYVAGWEKEMIGVYVLLPTRPDTVELVNVAVDPSYQGQGIGKKLVLHALQTARQLGYATIEVGTGSTGANQLMLYQKCGFRMTGIDRDFFIRHYDEEIMENGMRLYDMVRLSQDL
ncbi:GNAT family N-acetyltransferase [Paenibacillus dakarensis]|uniref:GNAT family N-acetyltransferase n=1 Tax=Paenibacillus dakarensis TaxID=1527293 RepID=UPI0006D580ED|nr:GNAT family N-acetyltransferase [Paenibacillus dakarensis]